MIFMTRRVLAIIFLGLVCSTAMSAFCQLMGWGEEYLLIELLRSMTPQVLALQIAAIVMVLFIFNLHWLSRLSLSILLLVMIGQSSTMLWHYYQRIAVVPPKANRSLALEVYLLNVNSAGKSYSRVREQIHKEDPSLVILLEVTERWVNELSLNNSYQYIWNSPRPHAGILIASKEALAAGTKYYDYLGRPLVVASLNRARPLTLVVLHAQNPLTGLTNRNAFLDWVAQKLYNAERPLVIMGDFNTTVFSPVLDRFAGVADVRNSARAIGLRSTWRVKEFPLVRAAIDHVFLSDNLQVIGRQVLPSVGSDHLPLLVQLEY